MVERVTERTDGVMTERVTETSSGGETVVVQSRGGGGGAGIIIGFAILVLVVIAAVFLFNQNRNEAARTGAIAEAAESVGDAAKDVGDAFVLLVLEERVVFQGIVGFFQRAHFLRVVFADRIIEQVVFLDVFGQHAEEADVGRAVVFVTDERCRRSCFQGAVDVLHGVRIQVAEEVHRDGELLLDELRPATDRVRRNPLGTH